MTTSEATEGTAADGGKAAEGSASGAPLSSLGEMQAEHRRLLELARSRQLPRSTVLEFLRNGKGIGTLLDAFEDRTLAQSMLDYWTASLYSAPLRSSDAVAPPGETMLADFDSATVQDVAARAEAAVKELEPRDRETARRVLLRLVRIVAGPRRFETVKADRTTLERLDDLPRVKRVLQALQQAGALRVRAGGEEEADEFSLQYESLIRQWGRLKEWLERRARFRDAVRYGALIEGRRLDEARLYHDLEPFEQDFIAASSKKTTRRMTFAIGLLSLALLVSVASFINAYRANQRAASSRELAQAALDPEPDGSGLETAVKAKNQARTEEAERALHAALSAPVRVWEAPISPLLGSGSLAFSKDGKRLATVQADGSVNILDAASGAVLDSILHDHIFEVAFSRDHLATAGLTQERKYIDLWIAPAGGPISRSRRIADLEDVGTMAFSADGKYLVVAGGSPGLTLWDVGSGQKGPVLATHSGDIQAFSFSIDGRYLATSGENGEVTLWDARTLDRGPPSGRPLEPGQGGGDCKKEPVNALAVSSTGELATAIAGGVAIGSADARQPKRIPAACQGRSVQDVAFSPDGQYLATACEDGTARVWLVRSGSQISTIQTAGSAVVAVMFSPLGGGLLATASQPRGVGGQPRGVGEGKVALWIVPVAPTLTLSEKGPLSLGFARRADRALLVGSSMRGWQVLWDPAARLPKLTETRSSCAHVAGVANMRFTSDGRRVACAGPSSENQTLEVWDTEAVNPRPVFTQRVAWVDRLDLSQDGKLLVASSTKSGEWILWDVIKGRQLAALPKVGITSSALAPDGHSMAIGKDDGTTELWDLVPRVRQREFLLNQDDGTTEFPRARTRILAVAFSPQEGRIATVGDDGSVKLWDAANGKKLPITKKMYHVGVNALAFSADGNRLATASSEGHAKLWDANDGHEILAIPGHGASLTGIAFRQDCGLLAMAGNDGTVQLEILDVDWLSQRARERLVELANSRKRHGPSK